MKHSKEVATMKCKYYVTFLTVVAVLCALLMAGSLVTVTAADNLAANGGLELGNTKREERLSSCSLYR